MDNLTQWTVESALLHSDKANKRLFIVIVILLVALLGTNAGWIYYESQWAVVNSTEVDQEGDNGSNVVFVGGNQYGSETDGETDQNEGAQSP